MDVTYRVVNNNILRQRREGEAGVDWRFEAQVINPLPAAHVDTIAEYEYYRAGGSTAAGIPYNRNALIRHLAESGSPHLVVTALVAAEPLVRPCDVTNESSPPKFRIDILIDDFP